MRLGRPLIALTALAAVVATGGASGTSGATFTSSTTNGATVTGAADWVAPAIAVTNPGSPLKGTVTVAATATDAGAGVDAVTLQRSPAGAATWTDVCTDTVAPYSCSLVTTGLADGSYDLRAVASDKAANTATSAVVGARVVDNAAPAVSVTRPASSFLRGTVTIGMAATDAGSGVTSVRLQRAVAGAATPTWVDVCTDTTTPYACALDTTLLANETYDFRAIALDGAQNTATSDVADTFDVDNTAPTATLSSPGTPVSGVVVLTATASDLDTGVRSVVFQRSAAGSGAWTDLCTTTADPYRCSFDTSQVADGSYDLRVVATDQPGNVAASATTTTRVDNTLSSVSLDDPGDVLRGTAALRANASSLLGVTRVEIQRAPAGSTTFTTICSDTTAPYTCDWVTTGVADGLYDLRAVMTYGAALQKTSAVVAGRRVDNSLFRGLDVKAANGTGTAGRLGAADVLTLTWSQPLSAGTIVPGWTGTGTAAVVVRLVDGGAQDLLSFTTTGGAATTGLGTINLRGNYVRKNRTATFPGTVAMAGGGVTITLGAPTAGAADLRTNTLPAAMVWTPAAAARDTSARASSTTPVTESGTVTGLDF